MATETITKKALVDRIADETGQKRIVVKKTVQAFLDEIVKELADGNRLEFRDFGVFEVTVRAPRMAQNPKTLERVPVPAKKTVKFKVGRRMREQLESPGAGASTTAPPAPEAPCTPARHDSEIRDSEIRDTEIRVADASPANLRPRPRAHATDPAAASA